MIKTVAVTILGYRSGLKFRNLDNRIVGERRPDMGLATGKKDVVIRRSGNRHLHLTAGANDQPIRFLAETGANLARLNPGDTHHRLKDRDGLI